MKRKISIVIEDDENGKFRVYMEGDMDRIKDDAIPVEKLGSAELWAMNLFDSCIQILADANAIESHETKPEWN